MFVELLIGRVSRMTGNHPRYPRRPVRGSLSLGFSMLWFAASSGIPMKAQCTEEEGGRRNFSRG